MKEITYTINYQYGPYSGQEEVTLSEDDPRNPCDVMWARMERAGDLGLPMAYRSAKVIDEEVAA